MYPISFDLSSDRRIDNVLSEVRDIVIQATINSEIPYMLLRTLRRRSFLQDLQGNRGSTKMRQARPLQQNISFDLINETRTSFNIDGLIIEPVRIPRKTGDLPLRVIGIE